MENCLSLNFAIPKKNKIHILGLPAFKNSLKDMLTAIIKSIYMKNGPLSTANKIFIKSVASKINNFLLTPFILGYF